MANVKVEGIIIKQSDYGDGHRMLSIFAKDYGIIKAISYGASKSKSSAAAVSQILCSGEFDLYEGTKRLLSVNSAEIKDNFYPIYEDIEKLALVTYMTDITYALLGERNADNDILRLFLNSVYALAYRKESAQKIKPVYEFKLMSHGGYVPTVAECVSCGNDDVIAFDIEKGGTVCKECRGKNSFSINEAVRRAIDFIVNADMKKMLAFNANAELLKYLNQISETYVSMQLDLKFDSLAYYKSICMS